MGRRPRPAVVAAKTEVLGSAPPEAASGPEPPTTRRELVLLGVAVLVAAALAFHGLGNHAFWDDEANTAIFARNLLATGELTAWDGQNLIGFRTGAELDEDLRNRYMPPLQYYVCAAGLTLFGESSVGGRAPFVLFGIACLPWLWLFSRRLLAGQAPAWLPPLLLAVSPAFLLYIRNCRYYSLGAFFGLMLLASFVAPLDTRRRRLTATLLAAVAAAGLVGTHYINAAYLFAALPVLLLLPPLRGRDRLVLLGSVAAVATALGVLVLLYANPFAANVALPDNTPRGTRLLTLLWWHLRDQAVFEHVPVVLVLALPLPFLVRRLATSRLLALIGLTLGAIFVTAAVVTALVSPQPVEISNVADMRHMVPLIPLGSLLGAIALVILWRLARPIAVPAGILLVGSNLLHLGFLGQTAGFGLPPRPVDSTLLSYVNETFNDYETSTETLIRQLEQAPEGAVVLVYPPYMMYPPMFYLPKLRYCCQLDATSRLSPAAAARLPDYVFWEKADVDLALIAAKPPEERIGPLRIRYRDKMYDLGWYRMKDAIEVFPRDRSRPEIPWHSFSPRDHAIDLKRYFFVVDASREPFPGTPAFGGPTTR